MDQQADMQNFQRYEYDAIKGNEYKRLCPKSPEYPPDPSNVSHSISYLTIAFINLRDRYVAWNYLVEICAVNIYFIWAQPFNYSLFTPFHVGNWYIVIIYTINQSEVPLEAIFLIFMPHVCYLVLILNYICFWLGRWLSNGKFLSPIQVGIII